MKGAVRPPGRPCLQLRNVCKHFHTRQGKLHVLEGVNLHVRNGEFLCLLGPSGCGKSTLLHIMAGLELPDSGEVMIEGSPVTGPGPDRAVVFQDGALFPWLTVRDNVGFGLDLQPLTAAQRQERVDEALELVRLGRFAGSCIHELSVGMRQRVALARALALRPKVLLMDEPFAAMDAQTRNVMQEELQGIWHRTGHAIVLVTHNAAEAVRLGDRIAVLSFRPGKVRREVAIPYPRPRLADDPHVLEIRTFLLREMKADVHAAVEEELGDAN
ncbi:MAG TPA: ABC transporter ATP-binding protein [Symbiobacteriaceae bacterium]|nr:ABC transporter ATP-binding protein [Symbiobacteriaceae bacterium]